jgi:glucose uptake protein GlcU
MSTLEKIGYALLALSLLTRWFRIVLPVAFGMLVGWLIDELTPVHSVWVTYFLLLAGLLFGSVWHNRSQPRKGSSLERSATP